MAISINKVSLEKQEQIIEDYKKGKSLRQIEKDYEVTRQTVAKFLEDKNIKNTKGNHYRIYNHNEDFFEVINSEKKAYWLGFMFADGHITNQEKRYGQDQFGLSCGKKDKEILYKFKEDIEATNPILEYERKDGIGSPLCRIQMTSQKTVDDLINKGCYKQKSLILKPPVGVPDELLHHFIRGFFDGDGSITKTTDKKTSQQIYGINFTSTLEICEWLKYYFNMGSIYKDKRRNYTYYYSIGGHQQVKSFYHILYDDATLWLDRKYNRFQEFLQNTSKDGV